MGCCSFGSLGCKPVAARAGPAQKDSTGETWKEDSDSESSEDSVALRGKMAAEVNGRVVPSVRIESDRGVARRGSEALTLVPKRTRCAVSVRDDETDKWGADDLDEKEEYVLALKDPNVRVELLERLATFRRNRELCDVVLFVKEREIFAHKVVLAAVSPALFDMFLEETNEDQTTPQGNRSQTSSPPHMESNGAETNGKNGTGTASTNGGPQPAAAQQPTTTVTAARSTKNPTAFFEFEQTDYECFEALVNFAYTASLEISSKKVAELYKTAYSLRMIPVVKACATYLADNLCIANCIGIRKQANFSGDTILMDKVDRFIADNVAGIVDESVEFTALACVKTRVIVNSEEFRTSGGKSLAERALQYFAEWQRKNTKCEHPLETLLAKTHLLYVEEDRQLADCSEMDERSSVGSCEIIQDYKRTKENGVMDQVGAPPVQHRVTGATPVRMNNGCKSTKNHRYSSTESLDSVSSTLSESEEVVETKLLAVHHTSEQFWIALVVLCRRLVAISLQLTDEDDINDMNRKNTLTNDNVNGGAEAVDAQKSQLLSRLVSVTGTERKPLATMHEARCSIGAAFVAGKIIVCGGYDRGDCLRSVEEYDITAGSWGQLKPMINERGRFDAAVVGEKVYAIAGSNGNTDMQKCEVYDVRTGKWTKIKSLPKARSHNGCAAVDGKVYTIGGTFDSLPLKDCERYLPDRDEWEEVAPLETPRYQAGVITWRGLIIAAGGCDRWNCSNVVEAYDPKTNTWRQLAKLKTPRRGCGIAVHWDQLYVIGGHDGTQCLASVEILDSPNGMWRAGASLTTPRANTKAVSTAAGVIYVLGGFIGNHFVNTIEVYENELTGWRTWQQPAVPSLAEEDEDTLTLNREEQDVKTAKEAETAQA